MSQSNSPIINWVTADCPSCGKTMKIRMEMVGSGKFLCPSCKTQVDIEFSDEDEEESGSGEAKREAVDETARASSPAPSPEPSGDSAPLAEPKGLPVLAPSSWQKIEPRGGRQNVKAKFESNPISGVLPTSLPGAAPIQARLPQLKKSGGFASLEGGASLGPLQPAPPVLDDEEFQRRLRSTREMRPEDGVIRARKRRKAQKNPGIVDWNDKELEEIPEAETRADEWLTGTTLMPEEAVKESSRDVLTHYEVVQGQEVRHIKRLHKKSTLNLAQLFFKRMTRTIKFGILAFVAAIAAAAIYLGTRSGTQNAKPTEAAPISAQKEKENLSNLLYEEQLDAIESLTGYLATDNLPDKLKWVRDPERVRPIMEEWYRSHPTGARELREVLDVRKEFIQNGYYILLAVRLGTGTDTYSRFYAIEQIKKPSGEFVYKVDWEMAEQYQPMNLDEFQEKRPQSITEFRLLVKPGDYWNHEYSDRKKWACYTLEYAGLPDFKLYGYIDRENPMAEELDRTMRMEANIIIAIRYPQDAISSTQVLIEKIVHPSHFYEWKEGPQKALKAVPNKPAASKSP